MSNPEPEVDFILSIIKDDWAGNETTLAAIPLERIDQDSSENIDTDTRGPSEDPEEMNFVKAATGPWTDTAIDSDYNVRTSRIVSLELEGLHVDEAGAIDPDNSSSVAWNTTTWTDLKDNLRDTLYNDTHRKNPDATIENRSGVGFKDLFIDQWDDQSRNYGDYYTLFAEIRLEGYENLPD